MTRKKMFRTVAGLSSATLAVVLSAGCPTAEPHTAPAATPASTSPTPAEPAASAASHPAATPGLKDNRPLDDADYIRDPDFFPKRAGIQRRFLERSSVNGARDPVFFPGSSTRVALVARIGATMGLWAMDLEKGGPAKLIAETPKYNRKKEPSGLNRGSWFFGTPQFFPDGKHIILEGAVYRYGGKGSNVLGVVNVKTGKVTAITVEGAGLVRTPTVHPDGKTVLVAVCNKFQTFNVDGFGNQTVQGTTVFEVKSHKTARNQPMCPLHRPRYSPDGKRIVFEAAAAYMLGEEQKKFNVPEPANNDDILLEPWIVDADGQNARRLLSDSAYASLGGRLQAGGVKEPEFSPDGRLITFAHGWRIAVASADGARAQAITTAVIQGSSVAYHEGDPTFSADGRTVAAASLVRGTEEQPRRAPAGVTVIDLGAIDVLTETGALKEGIVPPMPKTPPAPKPPPPQGGF